MNQHVYHKEIPHEFVARLRQFRDFSMFCHVHQPLDLIERLGRK